MSESPQIDQKANDAELETKPRRNPNQQTLSLPPDMLANLDRVAGRLGCVAMSGPNAGKPSWRAMMRYIGMGLLAVSRPGQKSFVIGMDAGEEKAGAEPEKAGAEKKDRKAFKCHFKSPPKWWPADTGCMPREELEAKTRLTEDELLEIGFSLTAGGALWRAPRNWPAWNPMSPVPDWWDDTDGSGAMMLDEVPDGVDVMADNRFAVSAGMVWPNKRRD
jgi:hypothetical protein